MFDVPLKCPKLCWLAWWKDLRICCRVFITFIHYQNLIADNLELYFITEYQNLLGKNRWNVLSSYIVLSYIVSSYDYFQLVYFLPCNIMSVCSHTTFAFLLFQFSSICLLWYDPFIPLLKSIILDFLSIYVYNLVKSVCRSSIDAKTCWPISP